MQIINIKFHSAVKNSLPNGTNGDNLHGWALTNWDADRGTLEDCLANFDFSASEDVFLLLPEVAFVDCTRGFFFLSTFDFLENESKTLGSTP